jgi:hypothetical protein
MSEPVDMEVIAENVRSYTDPAGQFDTLEVETERPYQQVLNDLIYEMEKRGVGAEKCVFYMSHNTHYNIADELDMLLHFGSIQSFKKRPIKQHTTMPDDIILFADPDSIGMGGKVYNPLGVVYAEVDTDE